MHFKAEDAVMIKGYCSTVIPHHNNELILTRHRFVGKKKEEPHNIYKRICGLNRQRPLPEIFYTD